MDTGKALARIRNNQGMTIQDLSRETGISQTILKKIEGTKMIDPASKEIKRILDALQTNHAVVIIEAIEESDALKGQEKAALAFKNGLLSFLNRTKTKN